MASITVPETIGVGETLTIEVSDTKNRYARVYIVRDGLPVYETFPRVRNGLAHVYIGPTPTWDGSVPAVGVAETGKLVGGRWQMDAAAEFSVV